MTGPRRTTRHISQWAWIATLVALVALVAGGVAVVVANQNDEDSGVHSNAATGLDVPTRGTSDGNTAVTTTLPVPGGTDANATSSSPPTTAAAPTPAETAPPTSNEVASTPPGITGDHASPVPVGTVADIGGGWRLQILSVNPDAAAAVAAENPFNEPPAEGSTLTLITVALGYFGLEDPKTAFQTTISAVGASDVELPAQCGVVPQDLNTFRPMFAGGVIVGNVCFVTTPSDSSSLQLHASGQLLGGDDVFLDGTASPADVVPMAALAGPQPGALSTPARLAPTTIGTAADIGLGWSLAVNEPARDITDAVLDENDFNAPPPDGFRFVSVDVTYTYNGEGSASAFSVTASAVGDTNLTLDTQCGVTPDAIDLTQDIFPGESVSGGLCFVVPEDNSNLVVYATADFLGSNVMFATS